MKRLLLIMVAIALLCMGGVAQAQYTITQIAPTAGYSGISLSGINDNGLVVGYQSNTSNGLQAFAWTQGGGMEIIGNQQYARAVNNSGMVVGDDKNGNSLFWASTTSAAQVITAAGTNGGIAKGINNDGQVVGRTGYTASNPRQGYIWDSTTDDFTIIGGQEANAINDNGEVVGNQRFRWTEAGGLVTFGNPGDTWGIPSDINNSGTVVGYLGNATGAFIQTADGTITPIVGASSGLFINDLGQVVGSASNSAFIWENGTMKDLNDLLPENSGWVLQQATGINNDGWIIGIGTYNGVTSGFVMSTAGCDPAVPEPMSIMLGIMGLGGVVGLRRRFGK